MVKAFVPKAVGTDAKTGRAFEYGGYEVELHTCEGCGNLYVELEQHAGTTGHKASALRTVAPILTITNTP